MPNRRGVVALSGWHTAAEMPSARDKAPSSAAAYEDWSGVPSIDARWRSYLQLEETGLRPEALEALADVVEALRAEGEPVQRAFAFAILTRRIDEQLDCPLRHPLFRGVVGPALVDGVLRGSPGCARWASQLGGLLWQCRELCDALSVHGEWALLQLALDHDPDDERAGALMLACQARYLDYSLHEVPRGVLYGVNGARVDECTALLELCDSFEALAARFGDPSDYRALLRDCRKHYALYAEYLRGGTKVGYPVFLESRGELSQSAEQAKPVGRTEVPV